MDDNVKNQKVKSESALSENTGLLIETNRKLQLEIKIRKKIETELNSTKNFLNAILEHIPNPLFVRDANTLKFTFVNKAVTEQLGYSKEDFLNKSVNEVYSKELADYYTRRDMEILKTRENFEIEEDVFLSKDNRIRIHNTKKILILNENNIPQYILDVAEDVTDKIRNRQELLRVDKYFTKLFNMSQVGVLVVNIEDRSICDVNPYFMHLVEHLQAELLNVTLDNLDIYQDLGKFSYLVEQASKYGKLLNHQINLKSKSGKIINTLANVEFLSFEGDNPLVIIVFLDISEIIKARQLSEEARKLELGFSTLKNRFVSMISHEYRTPLTSMMLSTDLLKKYVQNNNTEEINKHLTRIQNTIQSMTKLIENVTLVTRLMDDEFDFKPVPTDLNNFCKDIIKNLEDIYKEDKHIVFESKLSKGVHLAENNLLNLILSHILVNSLKYSYNNSYVNFDLGESENDLIFNVTDYGIGIPDADANLIFDTFHRGGNTSSTPGYGIGLSIVKKCIDIYKGNIEFVTMPGKGTCFTVTIPKLYNKDN